MGFGFIFCFLLLQKHADRMFGDTKMLPGVNVHALITWLKMIRFLFFVFGDEVISRSITPTRSFEGSEDLSMHFVSFHWSIVAGI